VAASFVEWGRRQEQYVCASGAKQTCENLAALNLMAQ